MGAEVSTARLDRLTALGFSVAEARLALEATKGDVDQAERLLLQERARKGHGFAQQINALLRTQKPWPEFFERFLWPEHLQERVATNLVYYQANYLVLCGGILIVSVLLHPGLLLVALLIGGLFGGAVVWNGDGLGLDTPLTLHQRFIGAGLGSSLVINWTGNANAICRVALLCAGVVVAHASFRARSLKARWTYLQEEMKAD